MADVTQKGQVTFLDLSAELRNEIYQLALPETTTKIDDSEKPVVKVPALLASNRQIRSETRPIFYSRLTFECTSFDHALKFAKQLDKAAKALLKPIQLGVTFGEIHYAKEMLQMWASAVTNSTGVRFALAIQVFGEGPASITLDDVDEFEMRFSLEDQRMMIVRK